MIKPNLFSKIEIKREHDLPWQTAADYFLWQRFNVTHMYAIAGKCGGMQQPSSENLCANEDVRNECRTERRNCHYCKCVPNLGDINAYAAYA